MRYGMDRGVGKWEDVGGNSFSAGMLLPSNNNNNNNNKAFSPKQVGVG